jgi:CubicO group peptidase (beta-lactamase class C family)
VEWTQASTAASPPTLSATIDGYKGGLVAHWQATVVLDKGYGFADRICHQPNAPTTTYLALDVSGSFSVLGALQLMQQSRLASQTRHGQELPKRLQRQ